MGAHDVVSQRRKYLSSGYNAPDTGHWGGKGVKRGQGDSEAEKITAKRDVGKGIEMGLVWGAFWCWEY